MSTLHMEKTGTRFDLSSYSIDDVHLDDIAYSLARTYRFNGNTARPVCVIEHSLYVSHILRMSGVPALACMHGLLHDTPEAYVGDIPSPVKAMLGPQIRNLEGRLYFRIWRALVDPHATPADSLLPSVVHEADRLAFYIEALSFCTGLDPWDEASFHGMQEAAIFLDENPDFIYEEQFSPRFREDLFKMAYYRLMKDLQV